MDLWILKIKFIQTNKSRSLIAEIAIFTMQLKLLTKPIHKHATWSVGFMLLLNTGLFSKVNGFSM